MSTLLWIIAVILVIAGIITILRGSVVWGIVLIVLGLLVGPGGVSLFDSDDDAGAKPIAQPFYSRA